ncbi:MAG: hypothetical protein AABZ15_00280 [Nitrospirota bacterium]
MLRSLVLLMLVVSVLVTSEARAEFYKWVDRDGREFITNEKEKIPAEYRHTAKPVEVRDDRVSVGQQPVAADKKTVKVAEHKDRYGRGEEYWNKRAENLRRQIREQQDELDLIVQQEENDRTKPKSKSKKSNSRSAHDKKKAKIEKKIARLKHELDVQLPEEARKADAYPGWIR